MEHTEPFSSPKSFCPQSFPSLSLSPPSIPPWNQPREPAIGTSSSISGSPAFQPFSPQSIFPQPHHRPPARPAPSLICSKSDRVPRLLFAHVTTRKADMKKEACVSLILFCKLEVFGLSFDYGLILNLVIWNRYSLLCVLGVFWKSDLIFFF